VSTNKLGFVPRSWTHRDFHGGVGPGETLDITVRSLALYSSALRQVNTRVYAKPGDPATVTYSYRTLSTNWSGIRMFAKTVNDPNGVSYLYGLTQYGLNRYTATLGSDGIFRISGGVVVGSSGWWPLKTWAFERTIAWGTGKADVFLATTSTTGELVEYVIPRSAPTQWSRKQLKPSGWGGFTSLNTGRCGGTLNTRRGYLGIQASGYAWTYYDANGEDYSGATLYSCARIATTWTAKPYGLSG
jgi:hypothetical protein